MGAGEEQIYSKRERERREDEELWEKKLINSKFAFFQTTPGSP